VYIPRGRAFRCLDCDAISDNSRYCEACGSGALVNEDKLLDRGLQVVLNELPNVATA